MYRKIVLFPTSVFLANLYLCPDRSHADPFSRDGSGCTIEGRHYWTFWRIQTWGKNVVHWNVWKGMGAGKTSNTVPMCSCSVDKTNPDDLFGPIARLDFTRSRTSSMYGLHEESRVCHRLAPLFWKMSPHGAQSLLCGHQCAQTISWSLDRETMSKRNVWHSLQVHNVPFQFFSTIRSGNECYRKIFTALPCQWKLYWPMIQLIQIVGPMGQVNAHVHPRNDARPWMKITPSWEIGSWFVLPVVRGRFQVYWHNVIITHDGVSNMWQVPSRFTQGPHGEKAEITTR